LGRMNELGTAAEEKHLEVARAAAENVDFLVVVGEYATAMKTTAEEAGLKAEQVVAFATPMELMGKVDSLIKPKDGILVKGSQNGVRLERVVKQLMLHPETAETLLVRQDPYWQAKA
jgi:UDP-N-acetylmuramoyl-tripeptide--D-alanyl-D-alanine ligase